MVDLMVKQSVLAKNTVFRDRVEMAMFMAGTAIAGEAVGVMSSSVYQKRQTFAWQMLSNPNAYLERFAWAVASNSTIAAAIGNPIPITSSTNASPIVVTTPVHGYTTGDTVHIGDEHLVNLSAVGGWVITVISTTTFSIPAVGVGVGGATGWVTKQPNDSDIQFTVNSLVNDFAGVTGLD